MAAVVFDVDNDNGPSDDIYCADLILEGEVSEDNMVLFSQTSAIYAIELLAPSLTLFELKEAISNKSVVFSIDNNAASVALSRGESSGSIIDTYVSLFWPIDNQYNVAYWAERVSSASNTSDRPARENPLQTPYGKKREFRPGNDRNKLANGIFSK